MTYRKFKVYGISGLRDIESKLIPAANKWANLWLNAAVVNVTVQNFYQHTSLLHAMRFDVIENRFAIGVSGVRSAYMGLMLGLDEAVSDADLADPFLSTLVSLSFSDLISELGSKIGVDPLSVFDDKQCLRMGEGWILISIGFPAFVVLIAMKPEDNRMGKFRRTAPLQKIDISELVRDSFVTLNAFLNGTKVTIGELDSLQVRDVLLINHTVNLPVPLVSADGTSVCSGALAKRVGKYALLVK